jgi:hypothetical protein
MDHGWWLLLLGVGVETVELAAGLGYFISYDSTKGLVGWIEKL